MEKEQMSNWKIEEIVFDTFGLTRFSYGPYNSEEEVRSVLVNVVRNIDRCSVIEWSTHNGESKMTFVPARKWKREYVD